MFVRRERPPTTDPPILSDRRLAAPSAVRSLRGGSCGKAGIRGRRTERTEEKATLNDNGEASVGFWPAAAQNSVCKPSVGSQGLQVAGFYQKMCFVDQITVFSLMFYFVYYSLIP